MGVLVQSKVTWGNQVYQGVPLDGQKLLIKEGKATQWAVQWLVEEKLTVAKLSQAPGPALLAG